MASVVGCALGTPRARMAAANDEVMGRKKLDQGRHLRYDVKTRINEAHFRRLQDLLTQSHYRSMSEMLRAIVCDQSLTIFTVDKTLDVAMEELVRIRKELHFIGHNINQTTKAFHSSPSRIEQLSRLQEIAVSYRLVGQKAEALLVLITQLSTRWLQK